MSLLLASGAAPPSAPPLRGAGVAYDATEAGARGQQQMGGITLSCVRVTAIVATLVAVSVAQITEQAAPFIQRPLTFDTAHPSPRLVYASPGPEGYFLGSAQQWKAPPSSSIATVSAPSAYRRIRQQQERHTIEQILRDHEQELEDDDDLLLL